MDNDNKSNGDTVHETLFNHESHLSKDRALELCSSHLQGNWTSITSENIDISVVEGGFVNRIFLCRNNKTNEKVLIRLYGGKFMAEGSDLSLILRCIGLEGEVLIFHTMDVNNIGPKLLGVFDGGRIEEYLEVHDTLTNKHIKNPEVTAAFARKLAKIHSLKMPFTKKPKDYINLIRHLFNNFWSPYKLFIQETPFPSEAQEEHVMAAKFALNYDLSNV